MPSKSDTHRRSGLYETQNSTITTTTVSNNCAQDRERYGRFWKMSITLDIKKKKYGTRFLSSAVDYECFQSISPICVCVCVDP